MARNQNMVEVEDEEGNRQRETHFTFEADL